jgi:16S rRNA (uracil1498-N3)-methyltransferase
LARTLRVALRPLRAGEAELDAQTSRYVSRVHRLREGDSLVVFDPEAETEADAGIVHVARGERGGVRIRVGPLRPAEHARRSGITLLAGLGKGDKPEQVLRDATALGADRIVLVETERTIVRDVGDGRRRRFEAVVVDAARQSGRGSVPVVVGPVAFGEALRLVPEEAVRVCLVPGAARTLADVARASLGRPLALLVGPEGGLAEAEVEAAAEAGFLRASLFGFVLRTETAAVAALAAALALRDTLPPAS